MSGLSDYLRQHGLNPSADGQRSGERVRAVGGQLDWRLVRRLADQVRESLAVTGLDPHAASDDDELRAHATAVVRARVDAHISEQAQAGRAIPDAATEQMLIHAVYNTLFGLDRLDPLLGDERVENIYVNGHQRVLVTYPDGSVEAMPPIADSDEELILLVQHLAAYAGLTARRFDRANPRLDLRLPDGSRLYAVMEVTRAPCLTIRRNRLEQVRLAELVDTGTLTPQLASLLAAAVRARLNVMVAGAMGAGKTTLLRALANEIGPQERIVTIEDTLELDLDRFGELHPNVVAMEARTANAEGVGEISIADLVYDAKRMNASRTIVGEVRGGEVVHMLSAMLHGFGSLSTIHVRDDRSTEEVFNQITVYAQYAGTNLSVEQINRSIAGALDLIVYIHADEGAGRLRRVVNRVREITGLGDGDVVLTNEIFTPGPDGVAVPATPISERRLDRLIRHGYRLPDAQPAEGWR